MKTLYAALALLGLLMLTPVTGTAQNGNGMVIKVATTKKALGKTAPGKLIPHTITPREKKCRNACWKLNRHDGDKPATSIFASKLLNGHTAYSTFRAQRIGNPVTVRYGESKWSGRVIAILSKRISPQFTAETWFIFSKSTCKNGRMVKLTGPIKDNNLCITIISRDKPSDPSLQILPKK